MNEQTNTYYNKEKTKLSQGIYPHWLLIHQML